MRRVLAKMNPNPMVGCVEFIAIDVQQLPIVPSVFDDQEIHPPVGTDRNLAEGHRYLLGQLYRLIDVLKVQDLPESGVVEHELALIKVRATESRRSEILRIIELYKGRVLDVGPETVIIEHSGTEQEVDSLVALLSGFGIKEMVRTGTIALGRGSGAIDLDAILRAGPEPAVVPARETETE